MKKVLFIGESWIVHTQETKGFDVFTFDYYEEGVEFIRDALTSQNTIEFHHIPSHRVDLDFPKTLDELKKYDVVMISDCGANTFNLPMKTFLELKVQPNKLHLIRDYVFSGGAFVMIGGYLTFQGIQARGAYKGTVIEEILPVELLNCDDRQENCQGIVPHIVTPNHKIYENVPKENWPVILGYNKVLAKEKAEVIAEANGDPLIVLGTYGRGRTCAYLTDCAPHWSPIEFCKWEGYSTLWINIVNWLTE